MLTGYIPAALPRELTAAGPHPGLGDGLALFGQFVGDWSTRVRFFDTDGGTVYDQPGSWSFGWVLDGRCVQDVLIYPNSRTGRAAPGRRGIGTSLRHYDPETGRWRMEQQMFGERAHPVASS